MAVIHHIRLSVSNINQAQEFYTTILTGLGFEVREPHRKESGELDRLRFTKDSIMVLISEAAHRGKQDRSLVGLHHLAFAVESREAVDQFYNNVLSKLEHAAIENPPVDCPEYRSGYYATFFYDPDGIKLEVTYTP